MKNLCIFMLVVLLVQTTVCLKQSDAGKNDWSLNQIGDIAQLAFPKSLSPNNNAIYFESELGIFGYLNKKDGSVLRREYVREKERIIQSNEKEIIIWTEARQIIRFNKENLKRTVQNVVLNSNVKSVNSYFQTQNRVYIGENQAIKYFDLSSASAVNSYSRAITIQLPKGLANLKTFQILKNNQLSIHTLTWNAQKKEVCLYKINDNQFSSEKNCKIVEVQLQSPYFYFRNNANTALYFGTNQIHYCILLPNAQRKIIKFVQINEKPLQYLKNGGVVLSNNKSLNDGKVQNIFRVASGEANFGILAQLLGDNLKLYEENSERNTRNMLASISLKDLNNYTREKIKRIWVDYTANAQLEVYVQFQNLQFVKYDVKSSSIQTVKGKQSWSRQQSLAYIQKILFMKYSGFTDRLNNPYHVKVDASQYKSLTLTEKLQLVPQLFLLRIKAEVQDIVSFITEKISEFKYFIGSQNLSEISTANVQDLLKAEMGEYEQKRYGLRKYIIIITKKNTLLAMDTKTSKILWKKNYNEDRKLVAMIKLKQEYQREIAVLITYLNGKTFLEEIEENGNIIKLSQIETEVEPTIHKFSPHSILIRSGMHLKQFDINKKLVGEQKSYNFYEIYEDSQKIVGWKNLDNKLVQTWEIQIPQQQQIIESSSVYRGQPESRIPISNDKRVIFKNVDFTNIAILTKQRNQTAQANGPLKSGKLTLYLINGLTGAIQFSQFQTKVNFGLPINLVYDENNAIVSYYSSKNRVYEIWTIEAYQFPLESQLLSKTYQPFAQKEDIGFRSKVYGTVIPIHSLHVIQSKLALLKRSLIIITEEMKVYLLQRQFVSTRRPKTAEPSENQFDGEFVNSKYPVEDYILPVSPLSYLSHSHEMIKLTNVRFSSTDLESTIFIFANGIDSFLVRIAPEKSFDFLADGFNYMQLIAVLLVVTAAAVIFRSKLQEAKLRKPHTQ